MQIEDKKEIREKKNWRQMKSMKTMYIPPNWKMLSQVSRYPNWVNLEAKEQVYEKGFHSSPGSFIWRGI